MNNATSEKQAARGVNPLEVTKVIRTVVSGGFHFVDQDGATLRNKATRPYTSMIVQQWSDGGLPFTTFTSGTPRPVHKLAKIIKVIPVEAGAISDGKFSVNNP